MSTVSGLSTVIPTSAPTPNRPSSIHVRVETRPASPCSLESGSSHSFESDSNTWAPAGVYIPVHRRTGSSPTTSISSSPRSSKVALPLSSQAEAKPQPRMYTCEELLALAPTSLVHASLHPVITPALLAKHPRILRARGDGVARALDMARQDMLMQNYFARMQQGATAHARVEVQGQARSTPTSAPKQEPESVSASELPLAEMHAQSCNQQRPTRRRARGRRRAQYQHNFAAGPRSENANLSLGAKVLPQPSQRRRQLDLTVISSWRAPQAVAV